MKNSLKVALFLSGEVDTLGYLEDLPKRLSSYLKTYLTEVNRFLFSGGLHTDVIDSNATSKLQTIVDNLYDQWNLNSKLKSLWNTTAIYGELAIIVTPNLDLEFYPKSEIVTYKDNLLDIKGYRIKEGKEYVFKRTVTDKEYITYPLVKKAREHNTDWSSLATVVAHDYGFTPYVVIKNSENLITGRGEPEFDSVALEMAIMGNQVSFDVGENLHFFGSPLFNHPDPEETIKQLNKRVQVFMKEANEDGGGLESVTFNAIKKEHLEYLKLLERHFKEHMGISVLDQVENLNQMSAVALRILNSKTIGKAEEKWLNYVPNGIDKLVELALRIKGTLGELKLHTVRKKPYFPDTATDKLNQVAYAESLINLGIKRDVAIQKSVFPELSLESINELLGFNSGD